METTDIEEFQMIITATDVSSTEPNFNLANILPMRRYDLIDIYYEDRYGNTIKRNRSFNERTLTGKTLPRLAFQVFEDMLTQLKEEERNQFKTYASSGELEVGVFSDLLELKKTRNSRKRKGMSTSDSAYLSFTRKDELEYYIYCVHPFHTVPFIQECLSRFDPNGQFIVEYRIKKIPDSGKKGNKEPESDDVTYVISHTLLTSMNIILHGPPGTGKSFFAKEIAADIVTDGGTRYKDLEESQKEQIGFVQFHPSYDYSDFVEGLRPIIRNGTVGFELREGVFKHFVNKARDNFEKAKKEDDIKKYVFIIDEINRGEIAKIFGELFYSISPDVRGEQGAISTQYANMHAGDDRFYIPENLYIIGTMNDIDRSADSLDFAMRRRFRFIFIKAESEILNEMLKECDKSIRETAIAWMDSLNKIIREKFGESYCVGPAYFLKLKSCDFEDLWEDYLKPLLADYIHVMGEDEKMIDEFESAYDFPRKPKK